MFQFPVLPQAAGIAAASEMKVNDSRVLTAEMGLAGGAEPAAPCAPPKEFPLLVCSVCS